MDRNPQILAQRQAEYNKIEGPRLGDFLQLPDGTVTRLAIDCEPFGPTHKQFQTGHARGSFYFSGGSVSYSGTLDLGVMIEKAELELVPDQSMNGEVWIFDQGEVGPHRSVYFPIPFRVFKMREGWEKSVVA
jgi:hypothetical protein